ncbi:MAG: SusC/RagA family TonB-linked outer membrane protein [Odoribacteraceae bacterium]|jgi:TonB-linked SusC/RagA family outer membrane protein|nr:SusC/RagA family TonB-linked outer membrane protein [Odoribacteraceae bacterium]
MKKQLTNKNTWRKALMAALLCVCVNAFAFAQGITVSGTVSSTEGESLPGVHVRIQGTSSGTTTDRDGKYSITVPGSKSVLVFSFIGHVTQEIEVGTKILLNVQLIEETRSIDEVVVIGYGVARKKDLTGAIIQIRPEKLADENPKTVQDILRGTPGLSVGYDPSAKGGGSMQIRGQRSVYTSGGHNDPLLILDGMMFYGELSEINPDDISQIDLLKDASAAAVYGAKAANGVVIITTKKGKIGRPVVNVSANVSFTTKSAYREVFDPEGYMQYREDWQKRLTYGINPTTNNYEAYQVQETRKGYFERPENLSKYGVSLAEWQAYSTNAANESDASIYAKRLGLTNLLLENYLAGRTYDWFDNVFRTGFNRDINASVSGASDRMNYYLSFGYLANEGAVKGNEYSAIRSNIKVEGKVTDWLEVGANINFQNRTDGDIQVGLGTNYWDDNEIWNSPYASHRDADGNLVWRPMGEGPIYQYNYDFNRQYEELEKGYTIFNSIVNAKIRLPYDITYSFNAAPRWQYFHDRWFLSADHPARTALTGRVNREQTTRFDWSLNNTISWEHTFADIHRVNLTLVQEAEERRSWTDRIEAYNILPSDALGFHNTANAGKSESSFSSTDTHQTADALLARIFYSYDNTYMLTASVRRDGYSAFGQNNPYATFPSVALGWTFTNEEFFKWTPMSTGKLRLSYGKNGNRSLSDPYVSLANLSGGTGSMQGYVNASNATYLVRYLAMDRLANPNLQWEKTTAWNFGVDFGFINDRVTGSLEYYVMNTHDMIMSQRLPGFSGFSSITTNLGEVQNRGFELSVNSTNVRNENFEWNTAFGFSYNKNEIKHLYYENEDIVDLNGNVTGSKEIDDKTNNWFIGQPIGVIWNYRVTGIWQVNEIEEAAKYGQKPGDPKVANTYTADDRTNADGSVTPVYNDNDREFLGQYSPPIHWSLRNDFTLWKDLTISFNIYSYMGHKSLETYYLNNDNGGSRVTGGYNIFKKTYWTPENPSDTYARLDATGPTGAIGAARLHDRSFIRLENISLGYTVPREWTTRWNIQKARVFGSIRNVAAWQKDWEYGDPETGGLATRVFTLGLNITL